MKRLIAIALSALALSASLVGCGSAKNNEPSQPVTDARIATRDEASTTVSPTAGTTVKATSASSTAPSATSPRRSNVRVSTTRPSGVSAAELRIPADDITSSNINPNIGSIEQNVMSEINALAVREISVTDRELTLREGESKELTVEFTPANAANKTIKAKASNKNVAVKVSGKTVTVTAKAAGESELTITSHNGKTAVCRVTVIPSEINDDTVLPYERLCTRENAQRWLDEIIAQGTMLGLRLNESLSGASFTLRTSDDKSDASFNSVTDRLTAAAEEQFAVYTGESYEEYEFNAVMDITDSGCEFAVTVMKIPETTE